MPSFTISLRALPAGLLLAGLSLGISCTTLGGWSAAPLPTTQAYAVSSQVIATGVQPFKPSSCATWKRTNITLFNKYCKR